MNRPLERSALQSPAEPWLAGSVSSARSAHATVLRASRAQSRDARQDRNANRAGDDARAGPHRSPTPLLVLGLGNVLLQDDGVGSSAVAVLLDRYEAPAGVSILDGGTLGLSLLPHVEDAENLILVDAVRTDAPAGTVVRLDGAAVMPAVATRLSPHQVGVLDLLDGARWLDRFPSHVALIGIVPEAFELSTSLTPPVEAALPALVDAVVLEAGRLGFPFARRQPHVSASTDGGSGEALDMAIRVKSR